VSAAYPHYVVYDVLAKEDMMAADRDVVHVSPESALGRALRGAAAASEPILVDTGAEQYELEVHRSPEAGTSAPLSAEQIARSIDGIRRASGAWRDQIDVDAFLEELYERRSAARRPSVEL
jgi:hypothetical protein